MNKLRVLLADDHAILRDGLALLINSQSDMEVVAQASTGREAVRLAQACTPDVAVLDVSMPDLGGAEAAEQMRDSCREIRVLALTRHADQAYVRRLFGAGAAGYVLKKSAAATLISAIRIVAQGGTYLEPSLAGGVVDRALRVSAARGERELSAREEDVLKAIAWGRTNKEIASELGVSIKTVESYKATATQKLQLRNRTDIVRYALTRRWLEDDTAPE